MSETIDTKLAGEVFDENKRLIGRYINLLPDDQNLLDLFCESWLKTYRGNEDFFLTLDLETTGLKPHKGSILLVSISWDGKNAVVFAPRNYNLTKFLEVLETIPLNNQNIKFDLKWLAYHYGVYPKVYMDTMVCSQLGWAGVFPQTAAGTFSLGNIAKHLLTGYELEKETRKQFIGMSADAEFTTEQIEYAVKDSLITHKLVKPIRTRLHNQDLWSIWENIERPLIEILVRSELKGVKINVEELERLLYQKETELALIYDNILEEIKKIPASKLPTFPKDKFNPASSQQIVNLLSAIGIKVLNTEKSVLQSAQAAHPHPLLQGIIEWRKTKSIISKFLTKWLEEHIDHETNCIYTTINTYGSETGRLSAKEPNLMQVPGDLRSMIVARPDHKILSIDFCYDNKTEVLTNKGWKLFNELDKTEKFYSLNPVTHEVEYVSAVDWIEADWEGKMLKVSAQSVDLLVTPNHKHFVNDHWSKDSNFWKFLTSEEIMNSDSRISYKKNCRPIEGLEGLDIQLNHNGKSKIVPIKDYLFLLGYWIADGTARLGNTSLIYDGNKSNLEYLRSRIEKFVGPCIISKTNTCWALKFNDEFITSLFRDYGKVWHKKIPDDVWNFDASLLKHLYDGLMLGDGTTKQNGNQYTTVSKQLADDFQRLLIHLGLSGSISYIERDAREFPGGKICKVLPYYCISVNTYRNEPSVRIKNKEKYRTNSFEWDTYTGKIYCVTLEKNHIIMIRRNGKQVWCGQSQFEFRAAAAATEEPFLIEAFEDRARLLPLITELANKYKYIDPDSFVKAVTKKAVSITGDEYKLVHDFALTDIHRRNASLILGKDVAEVTDKDRAIGKCVSIDSHVHTNKGIFKVRDFLPKKPKKDTYYNLKGVKVLTDTGYEEAPTIYYHGKSPVLKVTTKSGRELICTKVHRFRTLDKHGKYVWIQAGKLKPGMDVFIKTEAPFEGKLTYPLGFTKKEQYLALLEFAGLALQFNQINSSYVTLPGNLLDRVNLLLNTMGFKKTKINGPTKLSNFIHVYRPEIIEWIGDPEGIPEQLLHNCDERSIIAFLKGLAFQTNVGYTFKGNNTQLKLLQNLLLRIGVPSYRLRSLYPGASQDLLNVYGENQEYLISKFNNSKFEFNECKLLKVSGTTKVHQKMTEIGFLGIDDPPKINSKLITQLANGLGEDTLDSLLFLMKMKIRRDTVVSVTTVKTEMEVADFSVPSTSTVVYEGFITHNTLGYAVLYGAGPSRVQESLAKEGFYYTLSECKDFLTSFFAKLPKINLFIKETHARVLDPKFIQTPIGRKRFFSLPPKYLTRKYATESEAAFREATNFCFQGANADATKKSVVIIDDFFKQFDESVRPIILLTVHDEIVIEVHDSIVEEVSRVSKKVMIDAGMESINFRAPIECSTQISSYWSK